MLTNSSRTSWMNTQKTISLSNFVKKTGTYFGPSLDTLVNVPLVQQVKYFEKSSYCAADGQPARPASFSSGSAVWSLEMPLWSSAALHPHPPSDSLSILGNLDSEPCGSSSTRSSQKWRCSPPAAGTEDYMNDTIKLKSLKQTSYTCWTDWQSTGLKSAAWRWLWTE